MRKPRPMYKVGIAVFVAFAMTAALFGADHTLPWSYNDSAHPADVKSEVVSAPLATVFDTRLYSWGLFQFVMPPGLLFLVF